MTGIGSRADGEKSIWLDGELFRLIPYGEEQIDGVDSFSRPCHICGTAPGRTHHDWCAIGPGPYKRPSLCRDCGVKVGRLHIIDCGIEQCPRCREQYASCDCDSSEDEGDE